MTVAIRFYAFSCTLIRHPCFRPTMPRHLVHLSTGPSGGAAFGDHTILSNSDVNRDRTKLDFEA